MPKGITKIWRLWRVFCLLSLVKTRLYADRKGQEPNRGEGGRRGPRRRRQKAGSAGLGRWRCTRTDAMVPARSTKRKPKKAEMLQREDTLTIIFFSFSLPPPFSLPLSLSMLPFLPSLLPGGERGNNALEGGFDSGQQVANRAKRKPAWQRSNGSRRDVGHGIHGIRGIPADDGLIGSPPFGRSTSFWMEPRSWCYLHLSADHNATCQPREYRPCFPMPKQPSRRRRSYLVLRARDNRRQDSAVSSHAQPAHCCIGGKAYRDAPYMVEGGGHVPRLTMRWKVA